MEQNRTAWATDIRALYHEINTAKMLVHENKCDVLKFLVDCTAQYVQLWWIGRFGEEINTEPADAVGKELLGVLRRSRRLLQYCGEKDLAKSNFIIFCSAGEFCEIVDDVKRYSSMMNGLIERNIKWDPIDNPAQRKLIKQLQDKVELDCSILQDALISAHTRDSDAIKSSVKDSSFGRFRGLNMKDLSRRYISSAATLMGQIPATLMDPIVSSRIGCNIADDDIKILERYLGSGSFATVSKGLWYGILPVAIKQFSYEETFDYEYTIVRKLLAANCSHIVQVLGHLELENDGHGSRKILVMELMDMDLKKLMEKKMKETNPTAGSLFSVYESTDLMLQIAKGLRDLHRVQVVHRDIKPNNILVKTADDGSLTIKLADFGVSKANFQTRGNIHTKRGTTLYMAPEMAAGDEGKSYSRKVDVYSYGLVCMEILTGKPPNSAMPSFLKSIPIPLYVVISNCLEVDPDKCSSFEEICDHLWEFKESILTIQDEMKDEVPSYIDERVLSNFRMYTKTLGEEGISMTPHISTPTGKRAIYSLPYNVFSKGLQDLPIDVLVDIELVGRIRLKRPWHSVRNPFIGTGVGPQNQLFGNLQHDLGIFGQFKKLVVDQGKQLNISLRIGGWYHSENFSDAFSTDENRTRFINSVLELCRAYPIFNGLEIYWFYLSDDGVNYGKASNIVRREDGENFILVLEGLRSALPPGFVISIGSSRKPTKAKWPIERASHLVDRICLLSCLEEETAQHMTNLYLSSHQNSSYDEAVKYYISRGVDSSKLFISVSDYLVGYSNADEIGKPADFFVSKSLYSVCPSELGRHGYVERWDDEAKAPYSYHPEKKLIFAHDNARSFKEKAEYIKANNLGGIYINHCFGEKACSLVKIVHDHLTHGTLPKYQ